MMQTTTRALHYHSDFDPFRRGQETRSGIHYANDRNFPSSIAPLAGRMDSRICPVSRRGNSPPSIELETDSGNGQTRRRVAVACARCRKRKIRCSGDPGDGTGCRNCQAAGANINECKFHRVGSSEVSLTGHAPLGNLPDGFASSPNLSVNAMLPSNTQPYPPYSRSYPSTQYSAGTSRAAFSNPMSLGGGQYYADEPYGVQTAPFITTQESFNGSLYGYHGPMKPYATRSEPIPVSHTNRLYTESDLHFVPSQPTYINTAVPRNTITASESVSPFGMAQLQTSLAGAYIDRQLPPVPSSGSRSSITAATAVSDPLMRSGRNAHIRYTTEAMEWNQNQSSEGRHSFSGPVSEVMGPPATRAAVSSVTDNAVLGYIPITGSPDHSPTTAPSLSYSSTATSTPALKKGRISMHHGLPSTSSTEHLERNDSATNLYTLSSTTNSKRNSIDISTTDGGSLVSGQHYTPLMQPQPQHMASFERLRTESVTMQRQRSGAAPKAYST
ncbi:hypothetical protein NA57DRAFT_61524 [Rhizodiscina lignyota]|uniref:Zn(2)-C6 fungal-type domain-containing protein n=1 Tax=Rhizodiscina lignyota TaxID=1504668 RepID=A0A9P4I7D6_9PEZI|nr:hypothetical protein NA57DRAFT_61524 [Rhizodiscina lignyota]